MTRIGNVDQVLLLLREQLQRASRGKSAGPKSKANGVGSAEVRPLDRVRALAALDSLNDDEVRHALVRGILTEEFGEGIGNDAALQAIVDDVVRIISGSSGGPELIDRAVAQLREARA